MTYSRDPKSWISGSDSKTKTHDCRKHISPKKLSDYHGKSENILVLLVPRNTFAETVSLGNRASLTRRGPQIRGDHKSKDGPDTAVLPFREYLKTREINRGDVKRKQPHSRFLFALLLFAFLFYHYTSPKSMFERWH
jgi:hypothetical protein